VPVLGWQALLGNHHKLFNLPTQLNTLIAVKPAHLYSAVWGYEPCYCTERLPRVCYSSGKRLPPITHAFHSNFKKHSELLLFALSAIDSKK